MAEITEGAWERQPLKRTKKSQKPLAILTGDWHLRESQPVCRTDNFWDAQWSKVKFIWDLQSKYGCPILHTGDLFHHWKPSPYLLSQSLLCLPEDFWSVYGNHDLPQHNLDLVGKCGLFTLAVSNKVGILDGVHYGEDPDESTNYYKWLAIEKKVLVWHVLTWEGKSPWPGCEAPSAMEILQEHSQYDLIVTGDNHAPFVATMGDRFLVNPGSLTRQAADQIDHLPRVYLWYGDRVKAVYLPIEEGVVSREHIDRRQRTDKRIEAFVSMLSKQWEAGLSFEENLKEFFGSNRTRKSVVEIVHRATDKEEE